MSVLFFFFSKKSSIAGGDSPMQSLKSSEKKLVLRGRAITYSVRGIYPGAWCTIAYNERRNVLL